jgi:hypothetical protein
MNPHRKEAQRKPDLDKARQQFIEGNTCTGRFCSENSQRRQSSVRRPTIGSSVRSMRGSGRVRKNARRRRLLETLQAGCRHAPRPTNFDHSG